MAARFLVSVTSQVSCSCLARGLNRRALRLGGLTNSRQLSSSSSLAPKAKVALPRNLSSPRHFRRVCTRAGEDDDMSVSMEPASFPSIGLSAEATGDMVAIGVFEEDLKVEDSGVEIASEGLKALDAKYGGAVTEILAAGDFKGKPASSTFLRLLGDVKAVGVVGLGEKEKASVVADWGRSVYQGFGGQIADAAKTHKQKSVGVSFATEPSDDVAAIGGKIATGIWLGGYEATRFKAEPKISPLETVNLAFSCSEDDLKTAVSKAEAVARGVLLTRFLVEAPPNVCNPQHLADTAQSIADKFPDVMKLNVLEKEECENLGMGCYLAVAKGSDYPPKFIHLTYTPRNGDVKTKIGLVGKGLTFDSGGYNLKVGGLIELMKFDMGGSGATLGAAKIIGALEPEGVEIHFIVAACENMINGAAYRPGDVITASNGKTVEIINTDAEGRLTLADALIYAQEKCGVSKLVESSTLTGAAIVALGTSVGAVYSPSDELAGALTQAAKESGEKLWRMPLEDDYVEQIKSPIADLKNVGGRWGGSITAALFLRDFVDTKKVEFAHLDIAGPVWNHTANLATGYGAALLAEWAGSQGKQAES
ncbi:hypothetical protein BSKO_07795 [Bryopsis sp. KO-2023]|nr:hypothetical protein BSKO_07795 [Bryopsis sp. KO-2023]